MAFSFFGDSPGLFDYRLQGPFGTRLEPERFDFQASLPTARPAAPSIAEMLPPQVEPEYPQAPGRIGSVRDLPPEARRALFQQQLLQFAAAIGGPADGYAGNRMLQAASANLEGQQAAIEEANRRREEEYLRQRQEAERQAKIREQQAIREQQEIQAKARLATGQKAIELAGGEDTDPAFTAQVYAALRAGEGGTSMLQKLLDEAPVRRQMRDLYGIDPDDPLGRKKYEREQESEADIVQKKRELEELGPMKSAAELAEYEKKKQIDRRYPSPQAPTKDNVTVKEIDGELFLLNEDKGTWSKFKDPLPKARDAMDKEVETEAKTWAARARKEWNENPRSPRYTDKEVAAEVAAARAAGVALSPDIKVGARKKFDFQSAYVAALDELRAAVEAGRAKETSATTPQRGDPKPSPGKSVQDPKGAPLGIGGGKPQTVKPVAPAKEGAASVAAVEAQTKRRLTPQARKIVERLIAEGKTTSEIVSLMGGG